MPGTERRQLQREPVPTACALGNVAQIDKKCRRSDVRLRLVRADQLLHLAPRGILAAGQGIEVLAACPLLLGLPAPVSISRPLVLGPLSLISPTFRRRAQFADASTTDGRLRRLRHPSKTSRQFSSHRAVAPGDPYKQLSLLGVTQ